MLKSHSYDDKCSKLQSGCLDYLNKIQGLLDIIFTCRIYFENLTDINVMTRSVIEEVMTYLLDEKYL